MSDVKNHLELLMTVGDEFTICWSQIIIIVTVGGRMFYWLEKENIHARSSTQ